MAKKRISDVLIEVLANAGIERIYGITGDSLNSVNDSLRRNGKIAFEHVRHEETCLLYTSQNPLIVMLPSPSWMLKISALTLIPLISL